MTPENIEVTNRLIIKLEKALEKMPNMDGKLVFRGDDWHGYNGNIGEKIDLKAFSSVFNTSGDAFISEKRNILLIIEGKKGRVKDISSLAMGVNFGDMLKGISKTNNEGVILPKSIIKIVGKTITEEPGFVLNKVRFKQIK